MRPTIEIQKRLKALGFDPGPIDGVPGPKTDAAIVAFKRSIGFQARPFYGPQTDEALFGKPKTASGEPLWMQVARSLKGQREIRGSRHNPLILRMWEQLKLPFRDDETSWCAGYVGYCLEEAGVRSTRSAAARSYEKWGVKLDERTAPVGAVIVFWRGSPKGWQGHVGFLVGWDQRGRPLVLGGNQGDTVSIKPFDRARMVGLYWPQGIPVPQRPAPVVRSDAASSTQEA